MLLCLCIIRHSDDMIEKLESAGLGFFIKGEETKQKLGRLVYSTVWCLEKVTIILFPDSQLLENRQVYP